MKDKIINSLQNKKFFIFVIILTALLVMPGINSGFTTDDWLHRIFLKNKKFVEVDRNLSLTPYGMFSFLDGNTKTINTLKDNGLLPWWSFEKLRMSFWRPLTELTHVLDYTLWADSPLAMHIHSFILYGILLFLLFVFYRRLLNPLWIAGLAILLYAIDDAHAVPVSWIANRNALLAVIFGLATMLLYDSAVKTKQIKFTFFAMLTFILALLSGEFALATTGYLFAYMVALDERPLKTKIVALVPFAIIAVVWMVIYSKGGFGSFGSGMYIDPAKEPASFLAAFVQRGPVLLLSKLGLPPAIYYTMVYGQLKIAYLIAAYGFVSLILILMIPMLKASNVARFWLIGMIISLIPVCATSPDDRLLLFVSIGATGLLAQFIAGWLQKEPWVPTVKFKKIVFSSITVLLLFIHLLVAPALLNASSAIDKFIGFINNISLDKKIIPDNKDQHIILMNGYFYWSNMVFKRYAKDIPVHYTRVLSTGDEEMYIYRIDKSTIEIDTKNGFFTSFISHMMRSKKYPMKKGYTVKLKDLEIKILSMTKDNRPKRIRCTFGYSLDNKKRVKFFYIQDDVFKVYTMPVIGKRNTLEKIRYKVKKK